MSPDQMSFAIHNFGTLFTFTLKKTSENNPYFMIKLQKHKITFQPEVIKRKFF